MLKGHSPRMQELGRMLQACEDAGALQFDEISEYSFLKAKVLDIQDEFWEDLKTDPVLRALVAWRMGGRSGLSPYGLAEFAGGQSPLALWGHFVDNPHRFRRDVCDSTKLPVISPCYWWNPQGFFRHFKAMSLSWDTWNAEDAAREYEEDEFGTERTYGQELEDLFLECWGEAQPWKDFVGRKFQNPARRKFQAIISKDTWESVVTAARFQLEDPKPGALWKNPLTGTEEPWDPAVMLGPYDPTPEELVRQEKEKEEMRARQLEWERRYRVEVDDFAFKLEKAFSACTSTNTKVSAGLNDTTGS